MFNVAGQLQDNEEQTGIEWLVMAVIVSSTGASTTKKGALQVTAHCKLESSCREGESS